eukprot:6186736-Pleurochrysis_carterae.AAC.1
MRSMSRRQAGLDEAWARPPLAAPVGTSPIASLQRSPPVGTSAIGCNCAGMAAALHREGFKRTAPRAACPACILSRLASQTNLSFHG